jgi:hypothetical protein
MRLLTAFFVAALVLSATAWAQTALPNGSTGSFTVNTNILAGGGSGYARTKAKPATGDISSEIIWELTGGRVVYKINTGSIHLPAGSGSWSNTAIFNDIATAAVMQGTNMGINGCSSDCSSTVTTVLANSCVERTATGFVVLNPSLFSTRGFSVCCTSGGALLGMNSIQDPGCSGSIQ